jgi:hypothetical protein
MGAPMSGLYRKVLDDALGAVMHVEFTSRGPRVLEYAVVLLRVSEHSTETVRLYDSTHGVNEMHRYTRGGGKQTGALFHRGTLGEGMRAAIEAVEGSYLEMIEGWERG